SIRVTNPNSPPQMIGTQSFWYWFGYQHLGDFNPTEPWVLWAARASGSIQAEQNSPVGCEAASCTGPNVMQNATPRYYLIERDPSETRFTLDGAMYYRAPVTNTTDYAIMVRNYAMTSDLVVDWIR